VHGVTRPGRGSMPSTRKIAMVGREWNRLHTRLLAGGLHYASAHPSLKVVVQAFTLTTPPRNVGGQS
jgi:hypothetical protein